VNFAAYAHATYVPDDLTRSNLQRQFHCHPPPPPAIPSDPLAPLADRPGRCKTLALLANKRQSVSTDDK
jgi:hypothetical protein